MAFPTDTTKYLDESVKVTKNTIEFGPLKIYRVDAIPPNTFGRNGDIAIVDNSAVPSRDIATDIDPTVADLCQKQGGVWVCGLGGVGGPGFGQITTDAGTVTATTPSENVDVVGGPGITTSVVAGQVTITNSANIFANIAVPTQGTVSATGLTDTLNLVAGTNVTIITNPGTNTVTVSAAGGTGIPGLSTQIINTELVLVLEDPNRGGKMLSITEHPKTFSENRLTHLDWLDIGDAVDADSGYIAELNATLVFATGHCENAGPNSKDIELYINHAPTGIIVGTLGPGSDVSFVNTALDYDIPQGAHVSLRAIDGIPGPIQDTVVDLTFKWRA